MASADTDRKATRAELLAELGQYVSAHAVGRAAALSSDEEIAARVQSCRAQTDFYRAQGFEDAATAR